MKIMDKKRNKKTSVSDTSRFRPALKKAAVILLLTILFTILYMTDNRNNLPLDEENAVYINRNDPSKGSRHVTLDANINGRSYRVPITVGERLLRGEELETAFTETQTRLERSLSKQSNDSGQITKDLMLPSRLSDLPFTISWESSDSDVLDNNGHIHHNMIPKDGTIVTLEAQVRYREETRFFTYPVFITADILDPSNAESRIMEQIAVSEQNQTGEDTFVLPSHIAGESVEWKNPVNYNAVYLLILSILVVLLYPYIKKNEQAKRIRIRKELINRDYAPMVNKLILYLGCGLSIRNALEKAAYSYTISHTCGGAKKTSSSHPLYEELIMTVNELKSGRSISEALERMQQRIDTQECRHFCTLLLQNVKKGTKGLLPALKNESLEAFAQKKNRAKKAGDEAGAKLLIPTLMMFAVVLVIMIAPAFMSIHF